MASKRRPAAARSASAPTAERPWRTWLIAGGGVVFVILLIAVVLSGVETKGPSGVPEGTRVVPVTDRSHVEGAIDYGVLVPVGGPHNPVWLNCGYYSTPVRTENAVHSLEHAAVWITYRPDADQDTVDQLRSLAGRRSKVVVSPVSGQTSLIMATAWGHQLELGSVDDPRLMQFLNEFEGTIGYAPEPQGICFGGTGNPE